MVQLLKYKCLPIRIYVLEICKLTQKYCSRLTLRMFLMKLFKTCNIEIVHYCQTLFDCELPSVLLVKRYEKFIEKLTCTDLCIFCLAKVF